MRTSAIVAAFNEGPRVANVTRVLKRCAGVDEVIVVDDGSRDNTAEAARRTGVRVVSLPENVGKGGAIARGIEESRGDVVLLVDADLVGLTEKHVKDMLEPVKKGHADMTIGIFRGGRFKTFVSNAPFKPFTGQRAFRRGLFDPEELKDTRYGVETVMTQISKEKSAKVVEIRLDNITQVTKEEKLGFIKGMSHRMTMYGEVLRQFFRRAFTVR
ncbi:MAG TPA: glycosyltransferase family 2 protein [Bacillota bacterium]|nr:MAG: Glucosyl-3-phosphoglycerate synthase [Firmicutes bacterium ADurb.Bin153]HNV34729.1 glycosyltransferase family 2 protein [Bacillota bacterium]